MKMLLFALLMLMVMVTVSTIAHAKGPRTASYQCKHIGISKVKPFKHKATQQKARMHAATAAVHQWPKFRTEGYDY